jgi:hypothetical protein
VPNLCGGGWQNARNFSGMATPAGLYTTRKGENKAGMKWGNARVTPEAGKSHGDAGRKDAIDQIPASVTDIT